MQSNLAISIPALCAFLLVLTRVAGVMVFVPIPGAQAGPTTARAVLAFAFTLALYPKWPAIGAVPGPGLLVAWVVMEASLGVLAGVLFSFIAEAFTLGAQVPSLQAGYGYASAIDPNTQADSGILLILAQLIAGLLFFTAGLDRLVIAAFAASLDAHPPGTFVLTKAMAGQVVSLGGTVFSLGLRLALPIAGLLLMVDLALGVLGRINAQVQAGTLAFPLKMAVSLLMLAFISVLFPTIYESHAGRMLTALRAAIAAK